MIAVNSVNTEHSKFRAAVAAIFLFSIFYFLVAFTPALAAEKVVELVNPLGKGTTVFTLIGRLIQAFLGLVGSIALVIFIYAGIILLTSAGQSEKIKKAKDALIWTSIALVIIFSSYALVNFVISGLTKK